MLVLVTIFLFLFYNLVLNYTRTVFLGVCFNPLWLFSPPQEHDEPILKHLQDIKVKFSDPGQPMVSGKPHDSCPREYCETRLTPSVPPPQSFTLEFHFEPNDFFTNTVLTKTYKMRSEPDENDPFSFDGPEIMGCTG